MAVKTGKLQPWPILPWNRELSSLVSSFLQPARGLLETAVGMIIAYGEGLVTCQNQHHISPATLILCHSSCGRHILLMTQETLPSVAFMYVLWEHLDMNIYLSNLEHVSLIFFFSSESCGKDGGGALCHSSPVMALASSIPFPTTLNSWVI